jgi:hypothetical protein
MATACGGGGGGKAAGDASVEAQLGLDDAGILARQTRVENLIRECMRTKGFDYLPVDPTAQQTALVGSANMSKQDFEKQYGYGITTLYERRRQQAASGANASIRAALSESDRAVYDRTLLGDNLDASFAEALNSGDFSRLGGCTKEAVDKAYGGAQVLQDLKAKLDQLDERVRADPRIVKAIGEWSVCMRAAAYDLADPNQVDSVLTERLQALVGPTANAAGSASGTYDKDALAALQRDEVAMVAADLACEAKHLSSVDEKVRAEYEKAFRQENTGLLSTVPAP